MKILLLGSHGQVGSCLATRLLPLGEVVALDRSRCDLSDLDRVRECYRRAFGAGGPDIVVNAAAYTAVDRAETERDLAFRVNGCAVGLLAEECARTGALLVHYSTDYVYSGQKPDPYVETDPVLPLGAYGESKLEGERSIAQLGARALVLRTAWVFGPTGNNFVKTMLRLARERDSLRVVDDQIGNPTPAELIAEVTAYAIARRGRDVPTGTYHLAGSETCSWNEFTRVIVEQARIRPALGVTMDPARVERITTADYPTPAKRPANSRLDCSRLQADFEVRLPSYRPYLERMLDLRIG